MIGGKDPQQDQPEKGTPQIVDMDGPATRLVALVGSAWQRGEWIHGAESAAHRRPGAPRHGLRESDVSGRVAVDYLERVIRALEREAAHAARFGWDGHRSLWYLRRLPMEIFAGDDRLATTAPYDHRLAEVLMTRGSDPGVVPVRFDKYGCFPIDESVARRLARSIGFVKTVSEYQRHYRRCAKGATFRFERRDQLPSFEMSDELATAIRLYDERRADDLGRDVTQGLGTPVLDLERRPPKEREVEDPESLSVTY